MSFVSFPFICNGELKSPVKTQESYGIGEEANNGLGTVVAPAGA